MITSSCVLWLARVVITDECRDGVAQLIFFKTGILLREISMLLHSKMNKKRLLLVFFGRRTLQYGLLDFSFLPLLAAFLAVEEIVY